jgi:hypothetical protein
MDDNASRMIERMERELDTAQVRNAALEADNARLRERADAAYSAINDAILDAEDSRGQASLGLLITNATLRKLKEARAALAAYKQAQGG